MAMTQEIKHNLFASDFASMLVSRVCHDLISPVGALVNGLEILQENKQGDMHEFAMELINNSANSACAKLKFARLAFGASGSLGSEIDLKETLAITESLFKHEKANLIWHNDLLSMEKNKVKLLLNLILIASSTLPRGGEVAVEIKNENNFHITCEGEKAKVPADFIKQLEKKLSIDELTSPMIQFYYTIMLAQQTSMQISIDEKNEKIIFYASK